MMCDMEEIQLIEAIPEMTQMLGLLNKDIKTVINVIPVSKVKGNDERHLQVPNSFSWGKNIV